MSDRYPIISVTGSSGAGTTSIYKTFEQIFRRENVTSAYVQGDAFHRYDRDAMSEKIADEAEKGNAHYSHFGEDANLFCELEQLFVDYATSGHGRTRYYAHDDEEAQRFGVPSGKFTDWTSLPSDTDVMLYEGLHGAVVTENANIAQHADLKIGIVPVLNLEWIQKIHRDKDRRGFSPADTAETILRRMPDYVKYICPQFSETDINFQRVPMVDTSNPFIARWIPTPDESMVVIRFKNPRQIDCTYLLRMIHDSFMSRANSIVIPGGKLDLAMQLIFTPMIMQLVERRRRAL
ncbi:MAG: phosphoribulokinase [Hyphomicrobiaceae bacterium]